jgi:hypothetical protein
VNDEGCRVAVTSPSPAADGGYLALADAAAAMKSAGTDYRIIGGHMTAAHAARAGLSSQFASADEDLNDVDLALDHLDLAGIDIVGALGGLGYVKTGGNRFTRSPDRTERIIDVLTPSGTSRVRHNRQAGQLVVDEIPGLRYALSRLPVQMDLSARLTSGDVLDMTVRFPDAVAALCLKAAAYASRHARRDAFDVWRLLEVLHADGMNAADWPDTSTPREAAAILRRDFLAPGANGVKAAANSAQDQARVRLLTAGIAGIG